MVHVSGGFRVPRRRGPGEIDPLPTPGRSIIILRRPRFQPADIVAAAAATGSFLRAKSPRGGRPRRCSICRDTGRRSIMAFRSCGRRRSHYYTPRRERDWLSLTLKSVQRVDGPVCSSTRASPVKVAFRQTMSDEPRLSTCRERHGQPPHERAMTLGSTRPASRAGGKIGELPFRVTERACSEATINFAGRPPAPEPRRSLFFVSPLHRAQTAQVLHEAQMRQRISVAMRIRAALDTAGDREGAIPATRMM